MTELLDERAPQVKAAGIGACRRQADDAAGAHFCAVGVEYRKRQSVR
jgi:hypothetical protein